MDVNDITVGDLRKLGGMVKDPMITVGEFESAINWFAEEYGLNDDDARYLTYVAMDNF